MYIGTIWKAFCCLTSDIVFDSGICPCFKERTVRNGNGYIHHKTCCVSDAAFSAAFDFCAVPQFSGVFKKHNNRRLLKSEYNHGYTHSPEKNQRIAMQNFIAAADRYHNGSGDRVRAVAAVSFCRLGALHFKDLSAAAALCRGPGLFQCNFPLLSRKRILPGSRSQQNY